MEEVIYYNDLYDIYKSLLTDKQKLYFEDYYFNNLSYGEMSEKYNISRNACYKQLKFVIDKLIDLEDKLKIYYKNKKIEVLIKKIDNHNIKKELENLL